MEKQPTTDRTNWIEDYQQFIMTPEAAVTQIKPGHRVFVGTGCGQPVSLVGAMVARSKELVDTEIIDFLSLENAPYAASGLEEHFRVNSLFIADGVRSTIQEGLGDYTPIFLSDIPQLFSSGQLPLDVALIHVSPPDERGLCSLGVAVDIVKCAAENASLVIAQVNPRMPRTLGDSSIHIHNIDILVPVDEPVIEVSPPELDAETRRIGEFIAALVDDGSTIEFGIGGIPQAVAAFLKEKKDLGIHTEMFTDSLLELIECGAINGSHKSMDRGKVTASFCMGSRRLYDYINNNPQFAFYPTEYVNDPFIISRQTKQVAINVALEVDLTGQVCADSIGTRFYSGIGGQVDFNRGAAKSNGGKAIIALPSTAKEGTVSRIKTTLSEGAGVVTTRGDVHYVVTEYGTAYLHGKSVHDRAVALIAIAHPKFREQLLKEAIAVRYIPPQYADIDSISSGPRDYCATRILEDGTLLNFRPMHPTDEPALKDLFYALSQQTVYYRFMSRAKRVQRKELVDMVFINHRSDVGIVATVPEAYGEEIIAVGRYYLDETTNMAEVAFVVRDSWQNRGIGTALMDHLTFLAMRNKIKGFVAEVLHENKAMQRVMEKSDCYITRTPVEDTISYRLEFK